MAAKNTVSLESFIASMYGAEKGIQYSGRVIQKRDELIEALNRFKGNAKSIDFLKGDIAEVWHGGTFNINAAQKSSTSHAEVPRLTDLGSPDIILENGKKFQLKYYKNAKKSVDAQATSNKQAANHPSTKKGASEKIESGEVSENASLYDGQKRVVPSDQLEDAKKELDKKIAKESINRPEEAKRYQETQDNLTDRVENDEGISSTPLTEEKSKEIAQNAQNGEVNPENTGLTDKDVIKMEYVIKNAAKAGLQSAAISAGISMVFSLGAKLINEKKYFWDFEAEDWKEVLLSSGMAGITGGISASVLNIVGSYSASAVPGVSAILMATFGIASLIPDYLDGELTTDEFIVEAEVICFDAALILLTGVLGQTMIPVPALGAVIGSVAGMIATTIIQELWGEELRELIIKFNEFIQTLFERVKDFFIEIWEKLKRIKDLLAYLLDDDFNHSLQYSYKRNLNSKCCVSQRKKIVVERVKCYE